VWIKLPYGEFIVQGISAVVVFAGGTGITAFTAFLDALTPAFSHKIYLGYGAREPRLLIYRDLAERASVNHDAGVSVLEDNHYG
jgi:NAD(P)H-flavin reductase